MYKIVVICVGLLMAPLSHATLSLEDVYSLWEKNQLQDVIKEIETSQSIPFELQQKYLGIMWHNLAVLKVSRAPKTAVGILGPLSKSSPKDYVTMAYLGSAQTMIGRDAWNPYTKLKYANKGIALLNKAAKKDKDNVVIRFIRINNFLLLPDFLSNRDTIAADLDYVIGRLATPDTDISDEYRSRAFYFKGWFLSEEGQPDKAKMYYQKSVDVSSENQWAKKAKDALDG